jgi:1,4-alpha-glucan branching enzyme
MAAKTGSKVPFELLAPYNEDVVLTGSWDDWKKPIKMKKGKDGVWRTEVNLSDGDYEYRFKLRSKSYFALDQEVSVSDPKAVEFTLDSHENSVVRVKGGKPIVTNYKWKHDDVPLPDNPDLIIYEAHVRDFRGGQGDEREGRGTFEGMIEKLDYLVDLGINAIELMPVNEFPGDYSWGYSQTSLFGVENSYGTPDDLCALIDECHARGIRVIYDAVYNHMDSEAPLTQIDYSYWFVQDNHDEPELQFGPKFDYQHFDTNYQTFPAREHVMSAILFWATEFHIDGIRFDATRAIKHYDLLDWMHDKVHEYINFKPFYTIAEHVPQDPTIAGPNGPMDAAWHENFSKQLMCTILGIPKDGREPFNTTALFDGLDGRREGFIDVYHTIQYIDNHDQDRIMWQLGAYANIFDDAAFRRMKMGASILLTAPGIPMLWMGQEFGFPAERTLEPRPIAWGLLKNERNQGLLNHYKHLTHLRKSNPALTSNNFDSVAEMPDRGIIAYKRWNNEGNIVLVVANLFDRPSGEFSVGNDGLEDGTWREMIFNYDVQIQGGVLTDQLGPSEVKIYIRQ